MCVQTCQHACLDVEPQPEGEGGGDGAHHRGEDVEGADALGLFFLCVFFWGGVLILFLFFSKMGGY